MQAYQKIVLRPQQETHVQKLTAILDKHPFALDFSCLGTGKTYTSSFIALQKAFKHVIVIAPVSVKSKWLDMKRVYGLPLVQILSFAQVRSTKCKQPKHGLLYRKDYATTTTTPEGVTNQIDRTDFSVTDKYKTMVQEGLLLIVDEMHNIKNVTHQFRAIRELIRYIVVMNNPTAKLILLSGSPIDKREQVITLFRGMYIIKASALIEFHPYTNESHWTGLQELVNFVMSAMIQSYDQKNKVKDLVRKYKYRTGSELKELCYTLFQEYIKPGLASAMPPVSNQYSTLHKWNGYFDIRDGPSQTLLQTAVRNLSKTLHFSTTDQSIGVAMDSGVMAQITRYLLQIETAKINTFYRLAKEQLDKHPHMKVVLCVNYTATLTDLARLLQDYQPLVMQGKTTLPQRALILTQFQTPSTVHRLLIGNLSVCSTGIDLDDKQGQYPRIVFASPNYNTITLYQLSHRFQRDDTQSDATIHFVFGKQCPELGILNALARKSTVMRETTKEQADHGIVFPGDIPTWTEE